MDENNQEKEKFDFMTFAKMYPNSNGSSRLCDNPREADEKFYTDLYYADDSVKTIKEFALKQDALDEST